MNVSDKLFDMNARVENIIWIAGAVVDPEALPKAFVNEFVSDVMDYSGHRVFDRLPALKNALSKHRSQIEGYDSSSLRSIASEFAEELLCVKGFLVEAATPIRRYLSDGSSTSSWGYFTTEWLYAETEQEIIDEIEKWVSEVISKAKRDQQVTA